jgi:hypothetical protein
MPDGSAVPATSSAASRATEPEVVAGISSGEGQPAAFSFDSTASLSLPRLMLLGGAMVLGLAASRGLSRWLGR